MDAGTKKGGLRRTPAAFLYSSGIRKTTSRAERSVESSAILAVHLSDVRYALRRTPRQTIRGRQGSMPHRDGALERADGHP